MRDTVDCVTFPCTQVEVECGSILMALVQNKIDLIDDSSMTPEEVESLAKKLKLHLFRTSVKENFNVDSGKNCLTFVGSIDYASKVFSCCFSVPLSHQEIPRQEKEAGRNRKSTGSQDQLHS